MTQFVSVFTGMTSVSLAESCHSDKMMQTALPSSTWPHTSHCVMPLQPASPSSSHTHTWPFQSFCERGK
jgi:hypothetical protein